MRKKSLSFLGIGLITLAAVAQTNKTKLPVVEVLGQQYYVYEAKKNQTFFNIANDFNWNLEELMRINSKILSPLEKGTKIYYPVNLSDLPNGTPISESLTGTSQVLPEELIQPITHLVKKGETVYSISLMYNIPIEKLYEWNPGSNKGIKAGEILKVNPEVKNLKKSSSNPEFYTIKKGDTLYQLAKEFNTTVAAILSMNRGIDEDNFRAGEVIKIPASGMGLKIDTILVAEPRVLGFSSYKVEKKDTWDSIASKTGVSVDELKSANSGVSDLKNKQIIGVPEVVVDSVAKAIYTEDSRELTMSGVNEIYEDIHQQKALSDSINIVKIAILMAEPTTKKDLDFTRGFLTGVNRLKGTPYKIDIKVFDGRLDSGALIDSLGTYSPTMLFTTFEKNTPSYLADYALVSQVPVVNTFDVKDETFLNNAYFINILTPSNFFNEEIANNLSARYPEATLIVVGAEENKNDALAQAILSKWEGKKILNIESAKALQNVKGSTGESFIIFGNVTKKEDIIALCEEVSKFRDTNYNCSVGFMGRPNWIVYDESLNESLKKSDVMVPSRFYFDKKSTEAQLFYSEYKDLFHSTPAKSFPMYSTMGYDEAQYFIPSIVNSKGDLNNFSVSTNTVQSDFELIRPSLWSGCVNPVVYLVRFSPSGVIEKQKIK